MRPRSFLTTLLLLAATCSARAGYLPSQADAGQLHFSRYCAECHHASLRGSAHGAPLIGPAFASKWSGRAAADLVGYIRQAMSTTVPRGKDDAFYIAIIAYVLRSNDVAPGDSALESDTRLAVGDATKDAAGDGTPAQKWKGASGIAEAATSAGRWINRETPPLDPVTDALLADPPEADWLSWRRTLDGQGYSPLVQVDRRSVGRLRLAWSITMREGSNQGTPLVHDGVMFLAHPANVVQALDAATGDLIWEYAYDFPPDARTLGGPMRNIAIYGNRLFLATYDAAIVALDLRTGREVWRTGKADYRLGYTHTAGPLVADGVVVSGINGCERFKDGGCFITGHDPETGRELWRTSTIALPDDRNNRSWGKVPPELRGGGDTWIAGSYDPVLRLFYIGTSQAKPWVAASRGMSPRDAALYTNSTLALDPKTGAIRWYFQHIPGETLDMETAFERVLVDDQDRKLLLTVGKDGILWKLDRRNGHFLGLAETVYQNLYKTVDHKRGRVIYRDDIVNARIGDAVSVCPSIYGGHNWQASAYSPETRSLIVPLQQLCMEFIGREVEMKPGGGGFGGESVLFPMPGTEGQFARLSAYDVRTLERRWTHTQRAMFLTGALTTAGGLVFIGDLDRYFRAFDVESGKELWRTRLGAPLHGYPISYAVGGRQYVAAASGMGVFKLMTAQQIPDVYQPSGGNELYVFEVAPE